MGGNIARRSSTLKMPGSYYSPQEQALVARNAICFKYNQEGVTKFDEDVDLPEALHNCFVEREIEKIKVQHVKENEFPNRSTLAKTGTLIFQVSSNDISEMELRSTRKGLKPAKYVLDTMFPKDATEAILSFLIEPEYETKNEKAVDQVFSKLLTNYITSAGRPPQNILVFLETNGSLSNFSGREISEFLQLDALRQQYKCYVRCQEHLRNQGVENGYQWLREVIENRLNDLTTDPKNYSLVGPRNVYE